jgi:hypothetical protein
MERTVALLPETLPAAPAAEIKGTIGLAITAKASRVAQRPRRQRLQRAMEVGRAPLAMGGRWV